MPVSAPSRERDIPGPLARRPVNFFHWGHAFIASACLTSIDHFAAKRSRDRAVATLPSNLQPRLRPITGNGQGMPQIWMTYQELGILCGVGADQARLQAQHLLLDRRRSRDGNTRVKLNAPLIARFLETMREAEPDLDDAIAALRDAHQQMSGGLRPRKVSLGRGAA
jgi:hypothetical protein